MRQPEDKTAPPVCRECRKAPQDGCSHVVCPFRRPWGCAMPPASALEPVGWPGSGFKVRAKRGAE